MKIYQYKGPFNAGQQVKCPDLRSDKKYTKIGIQTILSGNILNEKIPNKDITIETIDNKIDCYINSSGILEFDNLRERFLTITFNRDFPVATTLEVGYE